MVSLTVAAQEYDFVIDVLATSNIQSSDIVLEFLPLGERVTTSIVGRVSAIDQPKVCGCLSIACELVHSPYSCQSGRRSHNQMFLELWHCRLEGRIQGQSST